MPTDNTSPASRPPSRGLRVRREAGLLARAAYDVAKSLPRGGRGDLADQLRRAATSVYANLAEGEGRETTADRLRCFTIAWGSLRELEALLDVAEYVGTPGAAPAPRARTHARRVGRMLFALRQTLAAETAHSSRAAPSKQRPTSSAPPAAPD